MIGAMPTPCPLRATATGLLLLAVVGTAAAASRPAPAEDALQVLRQAAFTQPGTGASALEADAAAAKPTSGDTGLTVALPDDWHARAVARPGMGRYRLQFELPANALDGGSEHSRIWALWSAQLPLHHRIAVNGQVVSDTLATAEGLQPRVAPGSVQWPAAALQAGLNTLTIDERGGLQAGLGEVWVGPQSAVSAQALMHHRLQVDLPRLLNMLAAGACLFMAVLWARKRDERALGWFALLGLLISVRNAVVLDPAGHAPQGWSLVTYLSVVLMNLLLGGFAHAVTPRPRRWFPPLLLAVSGLSVLLAVAAGQRPTALDDARRWGYGLMFPVELLSLWLVAAHLRSLPRRYGWSVLATLLAALLSGVQGWLLHLGELPMTGTFWLPWTAPLMVLAYGATLAGRLVSALHQVQGLNRVLELRVAERTASLAQANAAKSHFLAAASHDLRQPLVSISLLVGLLREQLNTPAQRQLVARVEESLAAMESLLRGLLDLSRLESGRTRVRLQAVALRPLLQAVADAEQPCAEVKGLRLHLRAPADAEVQTDPLLLEQIVRNLLSNAVRYTQHGGVLLAARRRGGHWCVQVWDTGAGIASARQAQVFEDFVQGDNLHRDRRQGLGLGLGIVRRACTLLGLRVQLRSVPGRGSCFWLNLPAALPADRPRSDPTAQADEASRERRRGTPASQPAWSPLFSRTVWLLEDDDAVRAALADRLRGWGARVTALRAPAELAGAIAAVRSGAPRPALLLTDMRLPGSDGLAAAQQLRQALGPLPVLVVTGNTAPEHMAALDGSGLAVLHKPFRTEALQAAVLAALAQGG